MGSLSNNDFSPSSSSSISDEEFPAGKSKIDTNGPLKEPQRNVVSFVPSARVSIIENASGDSSISSSNLHAFDSISRISDDETFDGMHPSVRRQSIDSHGGNTSEVSNESLPRTERTSGSGPQALCTKRTLEDAPLTKHVTQDFFHHRPSISTSTATTTDNSPATVQNSSSKRRRRDSNLPPGRDHEDGRRPIAPAPRHTILLSQPSDTAVLSPLHVFIRKQVEVFTATATEMQQPAPGRKNPVQLHQVGLRCIHCRDLPLKDRVKRAVCYPSTVGRVYHSVSDMKFDHFNHCKGLSLEIREQLEGLKDDNKNKREKKATPKPTGYSSSTAQYYHDSARQMGMVDAPGGVFLIKDLINSPAAAPQSVPLNNVNIKGAMPVVGQQPFTVTPTIHQQLVNLEHVVQPQQTQQNTMVMMMIPTLPKLAPIAPFPLLDLRKHRFFPQAYQPLSFTANKYPTTVYLTPDMYPGAFGQQPPLPPLFFDGQPLLYPGRMNVGNPSALQETQAAVVMEPSAVDAKHELQDAETAVEVDKVETIDSVASSPSAGSMLLSCPNDAHHLNPLHCFVRRHVELFAADKDDIKAPSPGRKTRVLLGQVGIRCIHCARLPLKDRVKRSVCYPPSVSGIYHSVSNMKFDHFAICRGLPESARAEFTALRSNCLRRGTPNPSGSAAKTLSNSTAQYYHDSALALGLVDTESGIRFKHDLGLNISSATTSTTASSPLDTQDEDQSSQQDLPPGISALMIAATDAHARMAHQNYLNARGVKSTTTSSQ